MPGPVSDGVYTNGRCQERPSVNTSVGFRSAMVDVSAVPVCVLHHSTDQERSSGYL